MISNLKLPQPQIVIYSSYVMVLFIILIDHIKILKYWCDAQIIDIFKNLFCNLFTIFYNFAFS